MNTRLRCLLIDDELPGLKMLRMLCEQLAELEVVRAFDNPEVFLAELPALSFDLCILDIEMPGISGLGLAQLLKGKPVIFTTAYRQYAVEAFDLEAVDYIIKPVSKERLQAAIQKVFQHSRKNQDTPKRFVQLISDKGRILLFFDHLAYVSTFENDSRDKVALLADGKRILLKNITFEMLAQLLPGDRFCQVNKRELVSLDTIQYFTYDEIVTSLTDMSGKPLRLTLSDAYRNLFLSRIR